MLSRALQADVCIKMLCWSCKNSRWEVGLTSVHRCTHSPAAQKDTSEMQSHSRIQTHGAEKGD